MSVEKEKNRKKAKELIFEAGYFYAGSPVGQWQGYDISFAESEKGRHDGPGLLVDGERFRGCLHELCYKLQKYKKYTINMENHAIER